MKKLIIIFSLVLLIILILGFRQISPILFQEGNPLPVLKGVIALNVKNSDIIKISDEPQTYLTKAKEGDSPIMELMEQAGWKFHDQMGSGYIFLKANSNKTIVRIQYTRKYNIWKF